MRFTRRRDLQASLIDGTAFGGMVGCGETYLAAFALSLGHGELVSALVSSLPMVAGGCMQLVSPAAIRWLGSYRRWVVLCAGAQAISFVPLLYAAISGHFSPLALLLVASVYWAAGLAAGPAWNTWIGTLVPVAIRSQFFANRTRLSQAGVFLGFLGGGVLLQYGAQGAGEPLWAYAVLFAAAALLRMVSAVALSRHSEPQPRAGAMRRIPWRELGACLFAGSGGKLLLYLVAVQAVVQMAGPFFTPFMLIKLDFSYAQLVGLYSVAFLSKTLAFSACGRIAKRAGAARLLWLGGIGIIPVSGGWMISQDYRWLMAVQVLSGVAWAAYELAFFLLFFESIPEDERTSLLTIYNLLNTVAWAAGSLVGAAFLAWWETAFEGYLVLFGLSTLGRLAALALLARVPSLDVKADRMGVRTVAVRLGPATLDTPVLPSLPDQIPDATEPAIGRTH